MSRASGKFFKDLHCKRELILRTESARLKDRKRYFEVLAKYEVREAELNRMEIERLEELVEELEGQDDKER